MALTTNYIRSPKNFDDEYGMGYQNTLVSRSLISNSALTFTNYFNAMVMQEIIRLAELLHLTSQFIIY